MKNSLKRRKDEGAGPREKCTKQNSKPNPLAVLFFSPYFFSMLCTRISVERMYVAVCACLCAREL